MPGILSPCIQTTKPAWGKGTFVIALGMQVYLLISTLLGSAFSSFVFSPFHQKDSKIAYVPFVQVSEALTPWKEKILKHFIVNNIEIVIVRWLLDLW